MLPPPAGEGWGGGSKVKIMTVGSIALHHKPKALLVFDDQDMGGVSHGISSNRGLACRKTEQAARRESTASLSS
jgi:hypothetical protein